MFLISDPLFQKVLVETVRKNPSLFSKSSTSIGKIDNKTYTQWSGLPIIYDEVFTGLYRLGEASCSSFLKTYPDISVHAKLLTGGLVPLSTTLASENIFETFLSDHKEDALLHGHSYTAHPVGCKVALESLKTYKELEKSGWNVFKHQWKDSDVVSKTTPFIWTVWSPSFLEQLSYLPKVENVFGLGTVLAITLKDDTVSGYASDATLNLQRDLLKIGSHGWSINTRGLGNVLYVMASQTTTKELILKVELRILNSLKK